MLLVIDSTMFTTLCTPDAATIIDLLWYYT